MKQMQVHELRRFDADDRSCPPPVRLPSLGIWTVPASISLADLLAIAPQRWRGGVHVGNIGEVVLIKGHPVRLLGVVDDSGMNHGERETAAPGTHDPET